MCIPSMMRGSQPAIIASENRGFPDLAWLSAFNAALIPFGTPSNRRRLARRIMRDTYLGAWGKKIRNDRDSQIACVKSSWMSSVRGRHIPVTTTVVKHSDVDTSSTTDTIASGIGHHCDSMGRTEKAHSCSHTLHDRYPSIPLHWLDNIIIIVHDKLR